MPRQPQQRTSPPTPPTCRPIYSAGTSASSTSRSPSRASMPPTRRRRARSAASSIRPAPNTTASVPRSSTCRRRKRAAWRSAPSGSCSTSACSRRRHCSRRTSITRAPTITSRGDSRSRQGFPGRVSRARHRAGRGRQHHQGLERVRRPRCSSTRRCSSPSTAQDIGRRLANIPLTQFSLMSRYQLTDKLAVAGTATYGGEVYGGHLAANASEQPYRRLVAVRCLRRVQAHEEHRDEDFRAQPHE